MKARRAQSRRHSRPIADASISVGPSANVTGQLLAGTGATGAVTMAGSGGNTIGGCGG